MIKVNDLINQGARDYQAEAISSLFKYFSSHKEGHPVLVLPCGAGKTTIISLFIKSTLLNWSNQRIVVATHVKELVKQNYQRLLSLWPTAPAGIFSAGLKRKDSFNSVIFGSIGSMYKKPELFRNTNLLIIDENDLVSPKDTTMYRTFIQDIMFHNPQLRVIGLTATPWRTKHGLLTENEGGIFTDICFDMGGIQPFNWLIDEGYLIPLIPKKTDQFMDTSGIKVIAGEFSEKDLNARFDHYEITKAAMDEVIACGGDRSSWLIFGTGIEHSRHIAEILNEMDVRTGYVHSNNKNYKMSNAERDEQIRMFDCGEYRAMSNNSILSVGYDNPKIDLIADLKPSRSSRDFVQRLGRGTRPLYAKGFDLKTRRGRLDAIYESGKHNTLVLDFPHNTKRLGPINDPVIPVGSGEGKKRKGSGQAPVKECPQCNTFIHASARECIHCAYEFPPSLTIQEKASELELIVKEKEKPEIETYDIDYVTYKKHIKKANGNESLHVTYFSNFCYFSEYIPIGNPKFKGWSNVWWTSRVKDEKVPDTVDEAVKLSYKIKSPKQIDVWTNKKYPEIVKYIF